MVGASRCRSGRTPSPTYRSSRFFARFRALVGFLSSLPAPGGRTEERGGTSARRHEPRRPKGPSPGGEGLLFCPTTRTRAQTMTTQNGHGQTAQSRARGRQRREGRPTQPRARRRVGPCRRGREGPEGHAPRGARPQAHAHRGGRPVRGPPAPGRRRLLQLPGRRDPAALRRPRRLPGAAPRPRPPRAGRRPRRRRLRAGHRQGRRGHGHVRPGRHQPRHRDRDGPPRFGADGRHHRQRARRR